MHTFLLMVVPLMISAAPADACEGETCRPAMTATETMAGLLSDSLEQGDPAPFDMALVLGISSADCQALIAVRHDESKIGLRVVTAAGKLVDSQVVEFSDDTPAVEFTVSALRNLEQAKALIKKYKLGKARAGDVPKLLKGVVTRKRADGKVEWLLVAAAVDKVLTSIPADAKSQVEAFFAPDECGVFLAGWYETEGPDDGPINKAVLASALIGAKAEGLGKKRVAGVLTDEAAQLLAATRYPLALQLVTKAFSFHTSPRGLYVATIAIGYGQDWKRTWKYARKLRDYGSAKATTMFEKLLREPIVREARLRLWNINGSKDFTFKASKGFEGTSVWVKIKDKTGKNVAIFKPTNGNTYHRGEVFTYQAAKLLGLEALYPVTVLHVLDKSGCAKFVSALEKVTYKGMKERNRVKLSKVCKKKGKLEGAVKEWVLDFQFFQAIGKAEKLKKHSMYKHLTYSGSHPTAGKMLRAKTVTRLYKPDHCKKATYKGKLDKAQLARDISDMMIMDVLNANEDRFPGANVDFKSLGKAEETEKCVFDFGKSRLFSLDNGATFKGTYSNALVDFTKRVKITRFNRATYERLVLLNCFVKGECEAPEFLQDLGLETVKDLSKFLALDKGDSHKRRKEPFKLFTSNLRGVLKHIRKYKKKKNAWFK